MEEDSRMIALEESLMLVKLLKERNAKLSADLYWQKHKNKELKNCLSACNCDLKNLISKND